MEIVPDEQYPPLLRYRTKGDANKDVDASLVSASNIIGKAMFAVPGLGYFTSYIQQTPGIYVAILVCGLMIAFVFYTDSLDEKQKQQAQPQFAAEKPAFDLTAAINQLSQKLIGKALLKEKEPPEPVGHQGYVPQQPAPPHIYAPRPDTSSRAAPRPSSGCNEGIHESRNDKCAFLLSYFFLTQKDCTPAEQEAQSHFCYPRL